MITLEEKVIDINQKAKAILEDEIKDYNTLLNREGNIITQHAKIKEKKQFNNIDVSLLYEIDCYKVTEISIVNIDDNYQYTKNSDYKINVFGYIEILPTGLIKDGMNIIVTYSAKQLEYTRMGFSSFLPFGEDKSDDELIKLKREATFKLNYKKIKIEINNYIGAQYFKDVCYLTKEQEYDFKKEKKETYFKDCCHHAFFMELNYIMYLHIYIKRLKHTQKHVKRLRAEAPPAKEVIKILSYIGSKHEATIELIKLLASFKGDYSDEIKDYNHKISYLVERETIQPISPPRLNIDRLSELRGKYKDSIKSLYILMSQCKKYNYKPNTESLLLALNLPIKPVDI